MKKENLKSESNEVIFRTTVNYNKTSHCHEIPRGVSETIPDQSYTVREIMERFVTNVPEFLLKNAQYPDNEIDIDDETVYPHDLDTIEKYQLLKDQTDTIIKNQKNKKQKTEKSTPETQPKEPNDITAENSSNLTEN